MGDVRVPEVEKRIVVTRDDWVDFVDIKRDVPYESETFPGWGVEWRDCLGQVRGAWNLVDWHYADDWNEDQHENAVDGHVYSYRGKKTGACLTSDGHPRHLPNFAWRYAGGYKPAAQAPTPEAADEQQDYHHDQGKALIHELDPALLLACGRVFAKAQAKYPQVGNEANWWHYRALWRYSQLYASSVRHLLSWFMREDKDPESGESHLAHAVCNISMLHAVLDHATDDRRSSN